jgi:hypothetical protein
MHHQRGQAVVETVIFLPMFMFVLYGMIWAIQTAVQYERVESAVRYSGLVSQYTNPYSNYSLYALYGQLGSTTMPAISCGTILTAPLSYGLPCAKAGRQRGRYEFRSRRDLERSLAEGHVERHRPHLFAEHLWADVGLTRSR